jgi:hypothetical protein
MRGWVDEKMRDDGRGKMDDRKETKDEERWAEGTDSTGQVTWNFKV